MRFLLLAWVLVGCGSVSSSEDASGAAGAAGAGAGGAGGELVEPAGAGGSSSGPGGSAGDDHGGRGGAGGDNCLHLWEGGASGVFERGGYCTGSNVCSASCRYPSGTKYVGCVLGFEGGTPVPCVATCADCP